MPARHQELPRPLIYHRIVSGIESADPAELAVEVFLPCAMTLKDPLRLVTREERAKSCDRAIARASRAASIAAWRGAAAIVKDRR